MSATYRRLTLLEAMFLVAATGIGVALSVSYINNDQALQPSLMSGNYNYTFFLLAEDFSAFRILKTSYTWVQLPIRMIEAWAPALLFLRLRRPRPALRELFDQPGTVACFLTAIVMALRSVSMVVHVVCGREEGFLEGFSGLTEDLRTIMPYSVASAWVVMVCGSRWRAEPSWIDRFGRLVGTFWVALLPWFWVADYFIGNGFE